MDSRESIINHVKECNLVALSAPGGYVSYESF